MDAFETVVAEILWREGYWVQRSLKVELDRREKVQIRRPTSPRWELDVVAYSGARNELLVVECKSYLDSAGVRADAIVAASHRSAKRYKLFHDEELREVVFKRLAMQLSAGGACGRDPKVRLALAAGHVKSASDRERIAAHFSRKGWLFFDESWIVNSLQKMAAGGYENEISTVVAKLLKRDKPQRMTETRTGDDGAQVTPSSGRTRSGRRISAPPRRAGAPRPTAGR